MYSQTHIRYTQQPSNIFLKNDVSTKESDIELFIFVRRKPFHSGKRPSARIPPLLHLEAVDALKLLGAGARSSERARHTVSVRRQLVSKVKF